MMAAAKISISVIPSFLTTPVLEEQVSIPGVDVDLHPAPSVNENTLAMLDLEFDIGEMSMATFIRARYEGLPLVALPLFTGRRFIHPAFVFSPRSGLSDPAQLKGKRIGLPQFWMTSSVWGRFLLRQEYGVSVRDASWVTFRPERTATLAFPGGVEVRYEPQRTPVEMLASGELDGAVGATGRGEQAGVVPAFPDLGMAECAYYARLPVFPIMHMIVMNERLAREAPGLPAIVCEAFEEAKMLGMAATPPDSPERTVVGGSASETEGLLGGDPWPYGIAPNRHVVESLLEDVVDQGLVDRRMTVEELFVKDLPEPWR